jgi:hypothetical protein
MGPEEINENKIQLKNHMCMPSLRFWMAEILYIPYVAKIAEILNKHR